MVLSRTQLSTEVTMRTYKQNVYVGLALGVLLAGTIAVVLSYRKKVYNEELRQEKAAQERYDLEKIGRCARLDSEDPKEIWEWHHEYKDPTAVMRRFSLFEGSDYDSVLRLIEKCKEASRTPDVVAEEKLREWRSASRKQLDERIKRSLKAYQLELATGKGEVVFFDRIKYHPVCYIAQDILEFAGQDGFYLYDEPMWQVLITTEPWKYGIERCF